MPLSRLVFSSFKNHSETSIQIFRRFGASKRFFSSIYTSSIGSKISPNQITEQALTRDPQSHSWFKKFDSSKRWYSTSSKTTGSGKRPLSLPEGPEEAVSSVSWTYFTIPATVLAGLGGLVFFIHSNDEKRAVLKGAFYY